MTATETPPRQSYTLPQIVLHWAVVALVVVQLVSSDGMEEYWNRVEGGAAPGLPTESLPLLHAGSGAAILVLMIVRLALRRMAGTPPLPNVSPALRAAGRANHLALYGVLILLPLTGAAAVLAGAGWAAGAHNLLLTVLWLLVALHIAAALYHTFIRRDGLIWRMVVPR